MKAILAQRTAVASGLETFIDERKTSADQAWQADALTRLRPLVVSGKLLRGSLVCYSYLLCSGQLKVSAAALRTAIALELSHTALLIHDDIIDRDDLRRGQPTLHAQYRRLAARRRLDDPHHYGESMALCVGDISLFLAMELLAEAQAAVGPTQPTLASLYARELAVTCAGQMQDIDLGLRHGQPTKQAIYGVMRAKTAAYSLALPLTAGAVLAGCSAGVQDGLHALGMAVGTIFQIRDDELGVFGRPAQTGKPSGADIREGKKTLLYYHLSKRLSDAELARFKRTFGNPQASRSDIGRIQDMMRRHGVPERLEREVAGLQKECERQIASLPFQQKGQDELRALVAFCAERNT